MKLSRAALWVLCVLVSFRSYAGPITLPQYLAPSPQNPSAKIVQEKTAAQRPRIAIIIDDIGYRLKEGRLSIELKHPLTLAFIPASPHAISLAKHANETGNKEILVHLPMSPNRKITWEKGLNTQMGEQEFLTTARQLVEQIPHAIGVNNHGGSLLTRDRQRMNWLMQVLGEKGLFFIDSRTTAESVAIDAASSAGIPFNSRDVFLDNARDANAISNQLDHLLEVAKRHGYAIAIGHPYPETLAVLEARLADIELHYELVGISDLLQQSDAITANTRSNAAIQSL